MNHTPYRWTYLLFFLAFSILPFSGMAQGQKFVFAEGLGGGMLASANFDMRFKQDSRDGFGARVGYTNSGFFGAEEWASVFPVSINYLYGQRRGGLLAGFNTTFALISDETKVSDYRSFVYGPELGYRFRPMERGLAFQVTWSPLFNTVDGTKMAWFGVGVGYAWK